MKTMGRALGAAEKRRRRLSRSPAGSIEGSRRQPPVHPPPTSRWKPGANKDRHIHQDHRVVSFLRRCFPVPARPFLPSPTSGSETATRENKRHANGVAIWSGGSNSMGHRIVTRPVNQGCRHLESFTVSSLGMHSHASRCPLMFLNFSF